MNPLLLVAAFLILGAALRHFSPTPVPVFLFVLLTALCLIMSVIASRMRLALALLAFCLIGTLRMDRVLPGQATPFVCNGVWQVEDFPALLPGFGQHFSTRAVSGECRDLVAPLDVRLYQHRDIAPGMRFAASLKIHPGYRKYYATLTAQTRWLSDRGSLLARWRSYLSETIHTRFSNANDRWLQALLIGNQSRLEQRDRLMLQQSGTSHLIAISGLHLALIISIAFLSVQFLWASSPFLALRFEPRSAALIAGLSIGAVYTLLSGAHIPVLRAWLMFATLAGAWFIPAIQGRLTGLSLAACVVVLIDPGAVLSRGAWLSFLATAGVLGIWPYLHSRNALVQWLGVQSCLSILLLPLLWALFGGISLSGFVINLLLIPWLGPLLILCLFALAFPVFTAWADWALAAYLQVMRQGAEWPFAYWNPHWQPTTACGLFLSLALLALLFQQRKTAAATLIAAAAAAALPFFRDPLYQTPTRKPAYILFAPEETIVINSGYRHRNRDDARRYLLPALRHRSKRPDAIVLTGTSAYQTTGLVSLLKAYPGTPVYTLVPMPDLPFTTQYCPKTNTGSLHFLRDAHCRLHIASRWEITTARVRALEISDR